MKYKSNQNKPNSLMRSLVKLDMSEYFTGQKVAGDRIAFKL
jgi:hypothetical protein